ncbi:MAG TPA: aminotransferase class I/II-fold pyridoxal phosphate-dependent enzyme, partial [Chthoniobacterales bacterium]
DQLRTRLWQNIGLLSERLEIERIYCRCPESAIIPVFVGAEERSLRLAEVLLENGFLIPAIRYPTVARGSARIRIALSAAHFSEQIEALATVINGWH